MCVSQLPWLEWLYRCRESCEPTTAASISPNPYTLLLLLWFLLWLVVLLLLLSALLLLLLLV